MADVDGGGQGGGVRGRSRGAGSASTVGGQLGELIGHRERNSLADTTLRGGHPRLGE